MNTKNNLRFQQTEDQIRTIFIELLKKKELSKITVREICEQAQINRTTFYLHHTDIYDLMEKIESDMIHYHIAIFTKPKKEYSLGERFIRLLTFIQENKEFYRVYLNNQRNPRIIDYTLLPDSLTDRQKLFMRADKDGSTEYEYSQIFFIAGFTAMIQNWLNRDCRETPEELLSYLNHQYSAKQQLFQDTNKG